MTALENLLRRWQPGWTRSREWNEYTDRDGIITVQVSQPARKVDYLLTDEAPGRLERAAGLARADEHPAGFSWLTVVTPDAASTRERLERHGMDVVRPEWLMTSVLAEVQAPLDRAADGVELVRGGTTYWVDLESRAGLIDVRMRTFPGPSGSAPAADQIAAGGRMVVLGTDAIADVIVTDPGHRRRGLGRAVMTALTDAAVRQGATDGLLVASDEGLHLYRALGWNTAAEIVIGRSR